MDKRNCSSGSVFCTIVAFVALALAGLAYYSAKNVVMPDSKDTFDEKIRGIIFDTVKKNPQLLMDAMGEGLAKKREDAIKQLSSGITDSDNEISKLSMKFGKLDSKNTIVCFFDPLCRHCIEFQKTMVKMIKVNKDICFKMLPVAVLGEDSIVLAKTYVAAYEKGTEKALKFIEKISASDGELDKSTIEKALSDAGLDSKEIEGMMAAADKKVAENGQLAEKLKVPVVPAIFFKKNGSEAVVVQETQYDPIVALLDGTPPSDKKGEKTGS